MDDTCTFGKLRHAAAREFAQTMIVIDDEANLVPDAPSSQPVGPLRRPHRTTRFVTPLDALAKHAESARPSKHALDAKSLIDNAMDLGLICSVLRPKKGENFQGRVVRAAKAADIVCLDWEIYKDSGDAASKIIAAIIRDDAKQNGRLRLIAIYTGDSTNNLILERIFDKIPKRLRAKHEFRKESLKIESKNGVRIVCLFKKHGVKLLAPRNANQVGEEQLPKRLQTEFAKLSEGLLSNVALATIASIRSSTHHVLSKFVGQMDGPFFHHRAMLENPDDAEEYAVDIVLSELKGAVDKRHVAATYAGPEAITARIQENAGDAETLTLHYEDKKGNPCTFDDLKMDVFVKIVTDGLYSVLAEKTLLNPPSKKIFEQNLSTLFSTNRETARSQMHQFAALTGVRAHPGSHLYKSGELFPRLGLGTIVQDKDKTYLMCLQASCDSVRIKDTKSFLFVPLHRKDTEPEHVVPISIGANKFDWVGLSTAKESYCVVRSIDFSACQDTETVNAKRIKGQLGFRFEDAAGEVYLWIADLKRRRALRTVQRLGQHMGRLGFDEFEPYRQREG